MTDAMSKALDELMGKHRNVADQEAQKVKLHIDDAEVCKHALAGLCPYTLFSNTKSDLGDCGMDVHDTHIEFPRLAEEYAQLDEHEKDARGYEQTLYELLVQLVHKMDRNISKNQEQVEKDNQPRNIKQVDQAKLDAMLEMEKVCIENSERLAMEGDADGSTEQMEKAAEHRTQHDELRLSLVTPERTKSVCEVCGVFINSTDNEQRRLDHINGKQYNGWKRIRAKLKELEVKFKKPHGGGGRRDEGRDREGRQDYASRGNRDSYDGYNSRERSRVSERYSGNERSRGSDRYGGDQGSDRYGGGYRSGGRHSERGDRGDRGAGYGREREYERGGYNERDRRGDYRQGERRGRDYDDRDHRRR